jgi:hypothetical protein
LRRPVEGGRVTSERFAFDVVRFPGLLWGRGQAHEPQNMGHARLSARDFVVRKPQLRNRQTDRQ